MIAIRGITIHRHRNRLDAICYGSNKTLAQLDGPTGICDQCQQQKSIDIKTGSIRRHRGSGTTKQCAGVGKPPRSPWADRAAPKEDGKMIRGKMERGHCQHCKAEVSIYPDGDVYSHKDRETTGEPPYDWCVGSREESQEMRDMPLVDPTDNHIGAASGYTPSTTTKQEQAEARRQAIHEHPLGLWWFKLAEQDLETLLPKADEYSAYDLTMIGRGLGDMIGSGLAKPEAHYDELFTGDAEAAEIACWFYALGKIGRAIGAIKEGRLPSMDTIADLRIYATMIARIRQVGAWPGVS
jgi:hypothetical protein